MKYDYVISGAIGVRYDWWTGQQGTTAQMVRDFLAKREGEVVDIAVSSPGGDVAQGLEIYQAIKDHGKCNMHIMGMTASAATFLCMGAKSVDMVDGSLILIHNASTLVAEWTAANKGQLDQIIAKYQKERQDLDTIDKVIASLYSNRCGKKVEDCLAKMDKAAWLTAQDALDFGIIDEIRKDDSCKKKKCSYSNDIFKSYGLPPFPQEPATDEFGNPSKSLIEKTIEAVKNAIKRDKSNQNSYTMVNIFNHIMGVLTITGGLPTNDKDEVVLTQEQTKLIDDKIGDLTKQVTDLTTAKDADKQTIQDLQDELKQVKDQLTASEEKVKNLEGAPGAGTSQAGLETKNDSPEAVMNRAQELLKSVM
jgi:ATP-dependent protease ClpP protease subunit